MIRFERNGYSLRYDILMVDNVNWDCYVNPPEDWYEQEPEDDGEEDYVLFEEQWLAWIDENSDWLEYLENSNGEA